MRQLRDRMDEEFEQAFVESGDPTERDLFLFVKRHSYGGQVQSEEPKAVPKLNFYVRVRLQNGGVGPRAALWHTLGQPKVYVYLNWQRKYVVPDSAVAAFREELRELFGGAVDVSVPEPGVPLAALSGKLDAFERVFLEFRDAIEAAAR